MDDKKLSALMEAVRCGSLSKAAAELGYTQSGLTQMMNSLEDELGCAILVRSYNGIKLTPAGERLLPFVEDASGSLKRLKDEASQTAAGQVKPIRIGVFPSISKSWLPYILKEYKKKYPGSVIEITVGNMEMQSWLDKDTVDLVLGEESMKGGYKWIPLREDSYFGVVPRDHELADRGRVSVEELVQYPFIMSQILELKQKLRPLIKTPISEAIQINADDDAALLSLVEEGLGVSILPEMSLKGHSELVRVLELDPPIKRTVGIVLPRSVRRHVSDFVNFVKDYGQRGI
jgi:DNA-binding transcriptional LysR family regulator